MRVVFVVVIFLALTAASFLAPSQPWLDWSHLQAWLMAGVPLVAGWVGLVLLIDCWWGAAD